MLKYRQNFPPKLTVIALLLSLLTLECIILSPDVHRRETICTPGKASISCRQYKAEVDDKLSETMNEKENRNKEDLVAKVICHAQCSAKKKLLGKSPGSTCEAYSSFEGVSTDHRIVTAKIWLSLRKNTKRTATTKHYDWALLNNRNIRDKYILELRNRFETLQEKMEKSTPNDEYENLVNAHLEAAAKCIPTKLKTKYRVPWETLAVREKRALVKTASKNYGKNPTNTNALKLKTAQYQLAGVYIKEQTEYIQNQIDKIRDSVEDRQSRIAWQTINKVSRRKNTAKAKLKAANQQERIKLWKQHFENLHGNPPKITHEPITRIISKQLDIKLGPFTQEELVSVLRKIKNRKAAGPDEIPPEVWKTRQFNDILLRHCNAV